MIKPKRNEGGKKDERREGFGLGVMKPAVGICNHLTGQGMALTLFPW